MRALIQMSHQALHLGHPDDALRFLNLAQTAASTSGSVSAATESYLMSNLGWCNAALANGRLALRALDESDDLFDNVGELPSPPWSQHVTSSERAGMRGLALTLLSRDEPRYAAAAVKLLAEAADGFGTHYDRTRLMVLPVLAVASLRTGEVDKAVDAGMQAIDVAGRVSTARVYPRLRALLQASEAYSHDSDLANLRAKIRVSMPAA